MAELAVGAGALFTAAYLAFKFVEADLHQPKKKKFYRHNRKYLSPCEASSSVPDEIALYYPLGIRKARHIHGPGTHFVYMMGQPEFDNTYVNARDAGLGQSIGYR